MSKRKTNFTTFHGRVASDSTKGSQSGRVDVLPPRAKQMALAVESMEQARVQIVEAIRCVEAMLSKCKPDDRVVLVGKLGSLKGDLERVNGSKVKMAREEVRAVAFYCCARAMMAPDAFITIDQECERLMAMLFQERAA